MRKFLNDERDKAGISVESLLFNILMAKPGGKDGKC